jgi:hypothetical protein
MYFREPVIKTSPNAEKSVSDLLLYAGRLPDLQKIFFIFIALVMALNFCKKVSLNDFFARGSNFLRRMQRTTPSRQKREKKEKQNK